MLVHDSLGFILKRQWKRAEVAACESGENCYKVLSSVLQMQPYLKGHVHFRINYWWWIWSACFTFLSINFLKLHDKIVTSISCSPGEWNSHACLLPKNVCGQLSVLCILTFPHPSCIDFYGEHIQIMNRSRPRGTDFILIHVYLSLFDDISFQKTLKNIVIHIAEREKNFLKSI